MFRGRKPKPGAQPTRTQHVSLPADLHAAVAASAKAANRTACGQIRHILAQYVAAEKAKVTS